MQLEVELSHKLATSETSRNDSPVDVVTPETSGGLPKYAYHHNAISRAAAGPENHADLDDIGLSATAQKLAAMAMALLPRDLSCLTVSFSFVDFCHTMGLDACGGTLNIFKKAVRECMRCVITLNTENEKGEKVWESFTWFTKSEYNYTTGMATMKFSEELAASLLAIKWVYSKVPLSDIGQLKSRYAIKILIMAASYMSMKGQRGNKDQCWYFERTISELRNLLGVQNTAYKATKEFKRNVIDSPIKEINEAGIGLKITPETKKQGRYATGIIFNCEAVGRKTSIKRKKNDKNSIQLPESASAPPLKKEKISLEHLKDAYPEKFAALYKAQYDTAPPNLPEEIKLSSATTLALAELHELYGKSTTTKTGSKKRV
jgi:plasmid replication initiation protein